MFLHCHRLFTFLVGCCSLLLTHGAFAFVPRQAKIVTHHALSMVSLSAEFRQPHFEVHTPTVDMRRVVECAEGNAKCRLSEIQRHIQDLQALNADCETGYNPERAKCQVDAVESRQMLIQALQLRAQLAELQDQMQQNDYLNPWRENASSASTASNNKAVKDHSFEHFRDFRQIAKFESH